MTNSITKIRRKWLIMGFLAAFGMLGLSGQAQAKGKRITLEELVAYQLAAGIKKREESIGF